MNHQGDRGQQRRPGPSVLAGRPAALDVRRGRPGAGGRARVRGVRRAARVRVPSDAAVAEPAGPGQGARRGGRVGGLGSAGSVHVQEELRDWRRLRERVPVQAVSVFEVNKGVRQEAKKVLQSRNMV